MSAGGDDTFFLDVDGVKLEARRWGRAPDETPTLLFLHEGLGCVAMWRDVPQKLAAATGFGALAFSRQGYGRSSKVTLPRPLDYMTREATKILPQVIGAAGLRRFALIGHSDGATIAAIYAGATTSPRLGGIALIAPHFFAEPHGLAAIRAAEQAYGEGLREKLGRYHDDVDGAFRGWAGAWLDPGFADWNVEASIARWQVPALVIQGDADAYGTLAQVQAAQAHADVLVLPGAGHAPHLEQPETTLAALAAFARRVLA